MAKFGSGKKPANQGSAGTPKVKPAKVSPHTGNKSTQNATPTTTQDHRGYHTPGKGGSAKAGPKPFKG